jgi:predicted ATPase
VVGEAGFGKSRLLYEFKQHPAQTGAHAVEGTCCTYGESISYLPFLDVVPACCGLSEHVTEPDAKRRLIAYLTTLHLEPAAVAPYLYNLLSFTVEDDVFAALTPELVQQRTVAALTALVVAEATQQPLVPILAADGSERVQNLVVAEATQQPLVLILEDVH